MGSGAGSGPTRSGSQAGMDDFLAIRAAPDGLCQGTRGGVLEDEAGDPAVECALQVQHATAAATTTSANTAIRRRTSASTPSTRRSRPAKQSNSWKQRLDGHPDVDEPGIRRCVSQAQMIYQAVTPDEAHVDTT